jgi:Fe2+ transport system protein FeoA
MNLCDLKIGESAVINRVNLNGIKKNRLYDIGFIKGERMEKVFNSLFDNPVCYLIKNNYIALRNEDAYFIEVTHE